jgi:superfamily II DNA or RNA helicase
MTAPVTRLLKLMKGEELRQLCRDLELSPTGNASELMKRLRSKLIRVHDGDEEDAARNLMQDSIVPVDEWRERLFKTTGQKPGRSYDALVDFVVQWAEGLLDDDDGEDFQLPSDFDPAPAPVPPHAQRSPPSGSAPGTSAPTTADIFGGIAKYFDRNAGLGDRIKTVFQFKLKNPDATWTIDLSSGNGTVGRGETTAPGCTIEMADADFREMCAGQVDANTLFYRGKMEIRGNILASQKLDFLRRVDPNDIRDVAQLRAAGWVASALAPPGHLAASDRANRQPNLGIFPTDGAAPPELKDYQRQAVDALARLTPHDPARRGGILCLPTGGGKTKTAVWWAMEHVIARGGRVLWLAARQELVDQAHDTFVHHAPLAHRTRPAGLRVRRIVAGSEEAFDGDVVVASVQTLQKRVFQGSNRLGDVSAIIFDEAHHAPAPTFAELLRNLGYESRLLVGLSATPTRTAESERPALKRLFPAGVVFQVPYETLMHRGYLAHPVQHVVSVDGEDALVLDADEIAHVSMWHDLPQSALSRLASSEKRLRTVADYIARRKEELKPMLVFAINQPHARALQHALHQRNVKSACVLDGTANRAQLVDALRNRQLDALVNVQVLTEGTDIPALNGVVITRPTMSRSLYQQMVGRGSRGPKLGGTEKFFVVDFTTNLSQFGNLLAYLYALETELPREVFTAPSSPTLQPTPTSAFAVPSMSPEVRAALDAALSDLRSGDPGAPDLPVAGWYTFPVGPHHAERAEEMLIFEPDRSAVASAVRQLEARNLRTMTEDQAQEVTFGVWNRELFARAVSLRKFLTLGEALRMGRPVAYVPSATLFDVAPIPDDHNVDATFSDDGPPAVHTTRLPLWLAAHFQRGGILTIDWEGETRLGIEQVGPGLVGLLGRFGTPPHARDVYRVDVETQRDGEHEVLTLVARVDASRNQAVVQELAVKVPEAESARFTDVVIRTAAGAENVVAGEVRRSEQPRADMG